VAGETLLLAKREDRLSFCDHAKYSSTVIDRRIAISIGAT
jgi:hypothetical protein